MKYEYHPIPTDAKNRKTLNEKVLYLIDSGTAAQADITSEDIYNAYSGDGGLHGLERKDYSKADLEKNKSHVILELAKESGSSKEFTYQTQKMLYQIKIHPATKDQYAKCCEYLHRFYTQKQPPDMDYKEWQRVMLTEAKVLAYLRRALRKQNRKAVPNLLM